MKARTRGRRRTGRLARGIARATGAVRRTARSLIVRVVRTLANVIHEELERVRPVRQRLEGERARSRVQSCGALAHIGERVRITDPFSVSLGNNVHVGADAYLETEGGLTIGDNTRIGRNVTISTTQSNYAGTALPHDHRDRHSPVLIGRNVSIEANATIAPGSRLGDGAIVRMGAVVRGDVPPLSVVVPAPVRLVGTRDAERYGRRERERRYGGRRGRPLEADELGRFMRDADDASVFFVVSTGRSGTTSIAVMLSEHPEVECHHERRSQLIRLCTEYAHGEKSRARVREELDAIYRVSGAYPPGVYGESDPQLFNLIGLVAELMPSSRFIWLIRDGRRVVASSIGRGWYDPECERVARPDGLELPGRWDFYRVRGDASGDMSADDWSRLSVFGRNCWYWSYVNRTIERQLSALPDERWTRVRLEELGAAVPSLFRFLGVEPVAVPTVRTNRAHYPVTPFDRWSAVERTEFRRLCGDGMRRWYPEVDLDAWARAERPDARPVAAGGADG